MAVTNYKRQEEIARANGGATPYRSGLQGVSANTAQQLGNYQRGYMPAQTVTDAQAALRGVQAQKPQSYSSKYGAQLDNILQQIQNPEGFKYSFDGDEMFKYYADLYTQKGRQASMDAMGQAAALTGGYGNSYAQQVGQQGYQDYLLNLYDRGMDLQNAAYQRYRDRQGDVLNQYNVLAGQEAQDYDRYRDAYTQWENDLARAQDAERYEREMDYNDYANQRDYWTNVAAQENADFRAGQQFDESKRQYDQGIAIDYATAILANGQMPSDELLAAAGLSYEDAMKLLAQVQAAGGGSGGGGKEDNDMGGKANERKDAGTDAAMTQKKTTGTKGTSFSLPSQGVTVVGPADYVRQLNGTAGTSKSAKTANVTTSPQTIMQMINEEISKKKK